MQLLAKAGLSVYASIFAAVSDPITLVDARQVVNTYFSALVHNSHNSKYAEAERLKKACIDAVAESCLQSRQDVISEKYLKFLIKKGLAEFFFESDLQLKEMWPYNIGNMKAEEALSRLFYVRSTEQIYNWPCGWLVLQGALRLENAIRKRAQYPRIDNASLNACIEDEYPASIRPKILSHVQTDSDRFTADRSNAFARACIDLLGELYNQPSYQELGRTIQRGRGGNPIYEQADDYQLYDLAQVLGLENFYVIGLNPGEVGKVPVININSPRHVEMAYQPLLTAANEGGLEAAIQLLSEGLNQRSLEELRQARGNLRQYLREKHDLAYVVRYLELSILNKIRDARAYRRSIVINFAIHLENHFIQLAVVSEPDKPVFMVKRDTLNFGDSALRGAHESISYVHEKFVKPFYAQP